MQSEVHLPSTPSTTNEPGISKNRQSVIQRNRQQSVTENTRQQSVTENTRQQSVSEKNRQQSVTDNNRQKSIAETEKKRAESEESSEEEDERDLEGKINTKAGFEVIITFSLCFFFQVCSIVLIIYIIEQYFSNIKDL